jgi:thioredoxin
MKSIKNVAEYQAVVESGKPVLLDFYADWCGPCQILLPTVEKLSEKYADEFVIAKVNVDENPELAQQFGVRSIPALFFVQNGEVKESLVGVQTETSLDKKIQEYALVA